MLHSAGSNTLNKRLNMPTGNEIIEYKREIRDLQEQNEALREQVSALKNVETKCWVLTRENSRLERYIEQLERFIPSPS